MALQDPAVFSKRLSSVINKYYSGNTTQLLISSYPSVPGVNVPKPVNISSLTDASPDSLASKMFSDGNTKALANSFNVQVGSPVCSYVKFLPLALQTGADFMKTENQQVKKIYVGTYDSYNFENVRVSVDSLSAMKSAPDFRSVLKDFPTSAGLSASLVSSSDFYLPSTQSSSGELVIIANTGWGRNLSVSLYDNSPSKLNINYVVTEVALSSSNSGG